MDIKIRREINSTLTHIQRDNMDGHTLNYSESIRCMSKTETQFSFYLKTRPVFVTRINWHMQLSERIAVFSENNRKPINTLCVQNTDLLNVKRAVCELLLCL